MKTTFLNGKLDVEIYMEQVEGFGQKYQNHLVWKLKKSLYGLKQSRRAWYECMHIFFVNKCFTKSHRNHSLYILQTCDNIVIVIIYVDDLINMASNVEMIKKLKSRLEQEFEMSSLASCIFSSEYIWRKIGRPAPIPCINEIPSKPFWNKSA